MNSTFENVQIDIDEIPHFGDVSFQPLEKDYLKVILITVLLFWVFVGIGLTVFLLFETLDYPSVYNIIGIGFIIFVLLFSFWVVYAGFEKKAFALRQHDILYKKGIFWKSITTIPFNRVQHCEVKQGPIDRIFDISQLNIFTAGGSQSDLTIPGLKPKRAQDLKNYIIGKTGHDESE